MRSLIGLMVALAIAALGCSVEQLPVPSAPPRSPDPSGPPASDPPPGPAGLRRSVDDILISSHRPTGELLVGTLGSGWRKLELDDGSTVVNAWGRIHLTRLTRPDGGEIVVSVITDADEGPVEVYRTADEADATTYASTSPDGSTLVVYSASIGTRIVDLPTGAETDLPAAPLSPKGSVDLTWSTDGRSFFSGECDMATCDSHVVELESLRATEVSNFAPQALGGGNLVGYHNLDDRDALMLNLATGERLPIGIDGIFDAMALSESRFLLSGGLRECGYCFVLVDLDAGTQTLVATDPLLRFPVEEFVDPNWVLLKSRDPGTVHVDPGSTLDVLDLVAGRIIEDVIEVPPAP